jgi:hypothetical protein
VPGSTVESRGEGDGGRVKIDEKGNVKGMKMGRRKKEK